MLPHVIITLLSCVTHVISTFQCPGTCYSGSFPKNHQVVKGKRLRGYSYKNITTDVPQTCFSSCINDCRCKAFQMKDVRCELLDEDKTSKAADVGVETGYVYYDLQQTFYKGKSHMVQPAGVCYNGCCRTRPCENGGTCVEHCDNPKDKFACSCPAKYYGKVCEKRLINSCIDVLNSSVPGTILANGTYTITRSDTKTTVPFHCAFETPNQAWTLIESFSLQNKAHFETKAFYQDNPRNHDGNDLLWNDYRLSLSNMQYIQTKATMFRATCDYPIRDSLTPDFLLGYKEDYDIINGGEACTELVYLNLKGYEFHSTVAPIFQKQDVYHLHLDISLGHCNFKAPSGASIPNEDLFGFYSLTNTASKCTATQQSTTQWWLGEQQ